MEKKKTIDVVCKKNKLLDFLDNLKNPRSLNFDCHPEYTLPPNCLVNFGGIVRVQLVRLGQIITCSYYIPMQ